MENDESEVEENNHLALVNTNNVQIPNPTPKKTRRSFNPVAPTFTPTSPGTRAAKENKVTREGNHAVEKGQETVKETTSQ